MVRVLALLLSLWAGPALAQGTFTTVVSPGSLTTSPLGVTVGASPHSVICISGCAAGASPSSVIVTNTPTVSLSTSAPFVQEGTNPWTVNGTVTASLSAPPAQVNINTIPTVTVSLSTSPAQMNINTIPTVTTSAVAGAIAVNVNNTVTASLSTSVPYFNINTAPTITTSNTSQTFVLQGTNPWVVSWTSPLTVGTMTSGAVVNVMAAGTSALAVTPLISPMAVIVTSGAVVVNSAAGTSPIAVTNTASPTAVAEQNGLAYPNRANWKQGSVTTTGTASAVVIPAPAANKLYITSLECWRSDAGTSPITMRFNDPAAQFTVAVANGATNMSLNPALVMSATTSLQFSASTSLTSVGCNAQGYNAP